MTSVGGFKAVIESCENFKIEFIKIKFFRYKENDNITYKL